MSELWSKFRAVPTWGQVIAWLFAWPLLAALWVFTRWGDGAPGKAGAAFLALLIAPIWYVGLFAPAPDEPDTQQAADTIQAQSDGDDEPEASESPRPSETESPSEASSPVESPSPSPTPTESETAAATLTVASVTDGDTLRAAEGGASSFPIRLSQVDAPETPDECYSAEAQDALASIASPGTAISLRRPGPPFVDDYDRRLGEVITADGESANVELVRRGLAAWGSSFAAEDPDLAQRLEAAEQQAKAEGIGLWGACGGPHVMNEAPPPPPPPAEEETTQPPTAEAETSQPPPDDGGGSNPWGTESCHPAYDPCVPPPSETGDLNCPDIKKHYPNGVNVDHAHGDPHGLDRDKDGHGCE